MTRWLVSLVAIFIFRSELDPVRGARDRRRHRGRRIHNHGAPGSDPRRELGVAAVVICVINPTESCARFQSHMTGTQQNCSQKGVSFTQPYIHTHTHMIKPMSGLTGLTESY